MEGFQFRRQAPLGAYVVDFACFAVKLIVEVDGGQHAKNMDMDAFRTQWLEKEGFRVLRFWNNEVSENLESVIEVIRQALKERKPR